MEFCVRYLGPYSRVWIDANCVTSCGSWRRNVFDEKTGVVFPIQTHDLFDASLIKNLTKTVVDSVGIFSRVIYVVFFGPTSLGAKDNLAETGVAVGVRVGVGVFVMVGVGVCVGVGVVVAVGVFSGVGVVSPGVVVGVAVCVGASVLTGVGVALHKFCAARTDRSAFTTEPLDVSDFKWSATTPFFVTMSLMASALNEPEHAAWVRSATPAT